MGTSSTTSAPSRGTRDTSGNRGLEFSARDVPRAVLKATLEKTAEVVHAVLTNLPDESLGEEYPDVLGGPRMPTGLFGQLTSHLAFHLGQVGYLRRILTGENESSGALALRELLGRAIRSVAAISPVRGDGM